MTLANGMRHGPFIFIPMFAALLFGGAPGAKAFAKFAGNIYEEKKGKVLYHVYAGGQLVCSCETNSTLFGGSDTNRMAYYYHEDDLNSSTALSSGGSSGSQIEVNAYFPFGRVMTASLLKNLAAPFTGTQLRSRNFKNLPKQANEKI